MCGIVLLYGPRAAERLPQCVVGLRHRGPDDEATWTRGDMAFGFSRLAINGDLSAGRQPYRWAGLVGAVNGEIYNWRELSGTHGLKDPACDTHVVLPLLAKLGPAVLDALDGFYAAVALDAEAGSAHCLRDHMGKKPLFLGRSGSELFITSELKVLEAVDSFALLPRGYSTVDLVTGEVREVARHSSKAAESGLAEAFAEAVRKRLPRRDQPVGIFLSGGLDSSLVAAHVADHRPDATCFVLGDEGGPDSSAGAHVADLLQLRRVVHVRLPRPGELPGLIRSVVRATESYNPSIVSNGLATYMLAQAARRAGIKVVLTGEGADELFGGYHNFGPGEPWRAVRAQLIDDMQFTELRRLDLSCMAHSVEPRCPFLDRAVRQLSDTLSYSQLYRGRDNKIALREVFAGKLPHDVLWRRKISFDVGSGVRGQVVRYLRRSGRTEREELRKIWGEHFAFDAAAPHFSAYPTFDAVIDVRGEGHR